MAESGIINVNIGILGHVDSGKTSLAKALSSTASTAAFDKSPESQRRGITLDLGFSACTVNTLNVAPVLHAEGIESVQCTFVDCPGHASLIKTILGGAQIIDIMILVIDAVKGIQNQTAECMVIGEVLQRPLVVVINKIDCVQGTTPEEKQSAISKLQKRLQKTFEKTRWPCVPMVEIAAAPRDNADPINIGAVLPTVLSLLDASTLKAQQAERLRGSDFVMMVDHCFGLKGHGTVFTGTVLRGMVRVGDSVLIPEAQVVKRVKGLQVFRRPVQSARRGDRVGLCVAQFDPGEMERGLICSAKEPTATGSGATAAAAAAAPALESTMTLIAEVNRVRFHHIPCNTHTKFHVTIGHSTVMASMKFFSRLTPLGAADDGRNGANPNVVDSSPGGNSPFDLSQESRHVEELGDDACLAFDYGAPRPPPGHPIPVRRGPITYYAIVLLERPVMAAPGTPFIAARLDMEQENMCRIAIAGIVRALLPSTSGSEAWRSLPIVRFKSKLLEVERVVNDRTCIAKGVVSADAGDGIKTKEKDTLHAEVQKFIGLRVHFRPNSPSGNDDGSSDKAGKGIVEGIIASAFGKTGKVKLVFSDRVFVEDAEKSKKCEVVFLTEGVIELTLKKYPLAVHSQLQQ